MTKKVVGVFVRFFVRFVGPYFNVLIGSPTLNWYFRGAFGSWDLENDEMPGGSGVVIRQHSTNRCRPTADMPKNR
jgi:hypothetical protein